MIENAVQTVIIEQELPGYTADGTQRWCVIVNGAYIARCTTEEEGEYVKEYVLKDYPLVLKMLVAKYLIRNDIHL